MVKTFNFQRAFVKWIEVFEINKYYFSGSIKCCSWYYNDDGICKGALCLILFKIFNFITRKILVMNMCLQSFFIIECYGAVGPDCSIPCNNNYFGNQCKNLCDCQKHEICNKYFGCLSKLRFKVAYINWWISTPLQKSQFPCFFKFHIKTKYLDCF